MKRWQPQAAVPIRTSQPAETVVPPPSRTRLIVESPIQRMLRQDVELEGVLAARPMLETRSGTWMFTAESCWREWMETESSHTVGHTFSSLALTQYAADLRAWVTECANQQIALSPSIRVELPNASVLLGREHGTRLTVRSSTRNAEPYALDTWSQVQLNASYLRSTTARRLKRVWAAVYPHLVPRDQWQPILFEEVR